MKAVSLMQTCKKYLPRHRFMALILSNKIFYFICVIYDPPGAENGLVTGELHSRVQVRIHSRLAGPEPEEGEISLEAFHRPIL
jgi:hypothetical protein